MEEHKQRRKFRIKDKVLFRNRVIFLSLLIGAAFFSYYDESVLSAGLFFLLLFAMILSISHTIICFISLRVLQSVEPTIVEHGKSTTYKLKVSNTSLLPFPTIEITFVGETTLFSSELETMRFNIKANSNIEREFVLQCRYRGIYPVGIAHLKMRDMLNVFCITSSEFQNRNIWVLPKITHLERFKLFPRAHGELISLNSAMQELPDSLNEIREFAQGDSLKRIHWKISARHRKLFVHELEQSTETHTLLFLDTQKGTSGFEENIIVEDKLIEALVSIARSCLIHEYKLRFSYKHYDTIHQSYHSFQSFERMIKDITDILFVQEPNIQNTIYDYLQRSGGIQSLDGSDIFIFTCNPDRIGEDVIAHLRGNNCRVFIVYAEYSDNPPLIRSDEKATVYIGLTQDTDVNAILEGDYQ